MSVDPFERLLGSMPKIAEAVNAFQSEDVQRQAFAALLKTLGATTEPEPDQLVRNGDDPHETVALPSNNSTPPTSSSKRRSTRKTGGKKSWTPSRGIDFFPQGKTSLRDFVDEKQPTSNYDKYAVAGYYLTEHLRYESFTVEDLLAAFKVCNWKAPTDPGNILAKTGTLKGWLDTSDTSAVKLSHLGRNTVEHNMPPRSKNK